MDTNYFYVIQTISVLRPSRTVQMIESVALEKKTNADFASEIGWKLFNTTVMHVLKYF